MDDMLEKIKLEVVLFRGAALPTQHLAYTNKTNRE